MTDALPDSCTILLVEDDYLQARDVSRTLTSAGASVLGPVANNEEMHALLEEHQPDVAIIDINLGKGPSFEAAERLDELGVPFMFLTGYGQRSIPAQFADVPRQGKPANQAELLMAIRRLCGSAAGQAD